MTAERQKCPSGDLTGDRHMVTDRRWTLIDPAGVETALCSPCCVIFWAAYATPADASRPQPTHSGIPHANSEVAA